MATNSASISTNAFGAAKPWFVEFVDRHQHDRGAGKDAEHRSMFAGPTSCSIRSARTSRPAEKPTSIGKAMPPTLSATASARAESMSATTTRAPRAARTSAHDLPIPLAPPVTRAIRPSKGRLPEPPAEWLSEPAFIALFRVALALRVSRQARSLHSLDRRCPDTPCDRRRSSPHTA